MNAEPMMPKACSIPCICKTFTKASSVVIFIGLILCNLGFTDFVLKDFSELTCGIAKRGQVSPRCLHAHARFWCLDREGSEHLAVLARHRHRHANDADEIFLRSKDTCSLRICRNSAASRTLSVMVLSVKRRNSRLCNSRRRRADAASAR